MTGARPPAPGGLAAGAAFALVAFAANSVLCRAALAGGEIGPAAFTLVRLATGALVLALLLAFRGRAAALARRPSPWPGLALLLYAAGFSAAYLSLSAGTGALILFGGVQVTMVAGALLAGERLAPARIAGAGLAFAGLLILFLPGAAAPDPAGAVLMAAAAFGWGAYSLLGRRAGDPLEATAASFAVALAVGVLPLVAAALALGEAASDRGLALAAASGGLASALGYAVWYAVLPRMPAAAAAVLQSLVPLLAVGGGFALLGERPDLRYALAALFVLGGVGLALRRAGARRGV